MGLLHLGVEWVMLEYGLRWFRLIWHLRGGVEMVVPREWRGEAEEGRVWVSRDVYSV